jgi:hypothetical protein
LVPAIPPVDFDVISSSENIEKTYISLFQKSTNAKDARIPLLFSADASRVAPIFYKPTLESIQLALELSALLEEMTRRLE